MEGFSWLQGRYPRTKRGDTFCRMTRSETGPNRLRQPLRELEPGRLYSVKLIAAASPELDKAQELAVSMAVDGAEMLDEYAFQFTYPSCYSHEQGDFTRDHPAHFTFFRRVFRAGAGAAELAIADRTSEENPIGPLGQEVAFNFVEVQPFWAP